MGGAGKSDPSHLHVGFAAQARSRYKKVTA